MSERESLYVFGYGTLINNDSRLATLQSLSSSSVVSENCFLAALSGDFGFERCWCFRSVTGFTALGLRETTEKTGVKGVVFEVTEQQLEELDEREKGYYRMTVPIDLIMPQKGQSFSGSAIVFVYIPEAGRCYEPTEEYPILQTYVDTCLSGCLAWGGDDLINSFISSTTGWSQFYLNDPPMSRRPWLHRPKCWERIDKSLNIQVSPS